jgi:ribosomal protein S12 methylthiotransferase accessory factor
MVRAGVLYSVHPAPRDWWRTQTDGAADLPCFLFRGRRFLGPVFGPQTCPTCLFLRLAQCFPHPTLVRDVFFGRPEIGAPAADTPWSAGLETLAERYRRTVESRPSWMVSEAVDDPHDVRWHRVLSPPGGHPLHEVTDEWRGLLELSAGEVPQMDATVEQAPVVDRFVGPIVDVRPASLHPSAPRTLYGRVAVAGFLSSFCTWHPDVTGSGLYYTEEAAVGAAVGEAAERYCANYIDRSRLVHAAETDLRWAGSTLSPLLWGAHVDGAQFPAYRFRPYDATQPEDWLEVRQVGTDATAWAPAEAVYLNYSRVSQRRALFPVLLAGVAAGTDIASAVSSAHLELVERDASMRWWHGGAPAAVIDELPADLVAEVRGSDPAVDLWCLNLQTDVGCCVVCAVVRDRERGILVTGFAARTHPASAIGKACAEAWQLHQLSLLQLDPNSELWREIRSGRLPLPAVPWRVDRDYRQAFAGDLSDMDQLAYNLQYYLDPDTHEAALGRLRPGRSVSYPALCDRAVATEGRELTSRSPRVYVADLTTADFAAAGLRVVRVLDPGLVSNYPTAFPPFWHPRLATLDPLARRKEPLPHA